MTLSSTIHAAFKDKHSETNTQLLKCVETYIESSLKYYRAKFYHSQCGLFCFILIAFASGSLVSIELQYFLSLSLIPMKKHNKG